VAKQKQLDEPLVARYPKWYDDFVLDEARHGHPYPLIARLEMFLRNGGEPLTDGEIQFVVKTLEATARKRGKDQLRKAERALIALQVKHLTSEGKPLKAAIDQVMHQRRRSRRHVFKAIAED
jgi:hypothetical protein